MLIAVDNSGIRYLSTDSTTIHREKGFYLCQECKQPIYLRLCLNRTAHFVHYPDSKECEGACEPDTDAHSMMKQDAYDYFKKFSWIQKIELEYPITITRKVNDDVSEKVYIPDIYIETTNNHKIAIECQAHRTTKDALLQRALAYVGNNIYPLFILETGEFIEEFVIPRDDLYISPKFEEKDVFIQRFYIYDPNDEYTADGIVSMGSIIYSLDVVFAKIPSWAPVGTHVESYNTKTDFNNYKINISKVKYHIKDEVVISEIPMVVDMEIPRFNFEKIQKLRYEEELRERLRQQAMYDKQKKEEFTRMEAELKIKKEEELQRKREDEIRKIKEKRKKDVKAKLESIDIDEPWALYDSLPNTSNSILLPPLAWKSGDQVSNLRSILGFFKKHYVPDKTKIMIYKSVCGSGKCCEKDTLVLTSRGIVRIEDIVKGKITVQKTIEESLTGDTVNDSSDQYIGSIVKSLDLKNIRLEDDIISNIFDMGESEIIDITTNSGFNIKCTPTHKLIIIDNDCNIIFKEAKDISVEDNIAIANGADIYGDDIDLSSFYQSDFYRKYRSDAKTVKIPNKMNESLGELLGYAIAEGDKIGDRKTIRIFGDEQIIGDRIRTIMNELGISSSEIFDDRRNIYDGVEIISIMFCDFLRFLGYVDGPKNKEVPWSILQSPKKVQIAFLKALFSGDGYVGNENKPHIEYYSVSKRLAEQLHIMLLNMGIFTSLREKDAVCVKENGERKDCGICYSISIFGRNDIINYINTIGFIQDYKKIRCADILKMLESKGFSYQSRTVKGSHIRLKRIYEEFKKLGKSRRVIKTWEEDVSLGDKVWKVKRHKELSAMATVVDRGFKGGNITEWLDGSYSASKRQVLKLLKVMKECYYLEDFRYLYNIATSNIEFDTVEKIDQGYGHVYDLTIRDNHSYIGNGFINHNSATLLHTIRGMGRGIIVTPFKNLQRQYYDDYFKGSKFVMKKDGTRLKVAVLLGRNNFPCQWLAEQYDYQQRLIEESKKPENVGRYIAIDDFILDTYRYDPSAANRRLPCTRPLKLIRSGTREPRWIIGSQCPYWIPTPMSKTTIDKWERAVIDSEDIDEQYYDDEGEGENIQESIVNIPSLNRKAKTILDSIKEKLKCSQIKYYDSVAWGEVGVFIRDETDKDGNKCPPVCPYYEQFYSYVDADVIVMNSAKWYLETMIGRKPLTDIEIFDEGDYWLDSQAVEIEISRSTVDKIIPLDNKMKAMKSDALAVFDMSFRDIKGKVTEQIKASNGNISIIDAKQYKDMFLSMTNTLAELRKSADDDERLERKIADILTILRYLEKASISYIEGKRDETKIVKIFVPYPDKILRELFEKSSQNIIVTSGTIHTSAVLSNLFSINADNYIVDMLYGRKKNPGKLTCIRHKEIDMPPVKVTHTSWQSPQFVDYYNRYLNSTLDKLKIFIDKTTGKPGTGKIIVLTSAKKYSVGIQHRPDIHIDFAKSNSEDDTSTKIDTTLSDYLNKTLEDIRKVSPDDINIDGDVLRTDKQIILSTRMIRGADLRDDKCRGLVILKWPVPDIGSGYNQALKKRFGDDIYWKIIRDKTEREAIQMVSRGLRYDLDWEIFSSPDDMAYNNIYRLFSYDD